VLILGEHLCTASWARCLSSSTTLESRPLVASQVRSSPDSRGATRIPADRLARRRNGEGPFFEVAAKLADEIHPWPSGGGPDTGGFTHHHSAAAGDRPLPTECPCFDLSGARWALPHEHHEPHRPGRGFRGTLFISSGTDRKVRRITGPGQDRGLPRTGWGLATGIAYAPAERYFVGTAPVEFYAVEPQGSVRRSAKLPASRGRPTTWLRPDGDLYVTRPHDQR